jgi:hypothetical protein
MPIPKPTPGEHTDAFIERCMGDSVMVNDYPDNAQRYAVCQSQVKSNPLQEAINKLIDKLNEKGNT